MDRLRGILVALLVVALLPWGGYVRAVAEAGVPAVTAAEAGGGAAMIGDERASAVRAPAPTPCRRANLTRSACAVDVGLIPEQPTCPERPRPSHLSIGPDWSFRDHPPSCPRSPPRPA